jgi:hypothetical protein
MRYSGNGKRWAPYLLAGAALLFGVAPVSAQGIRGMTATGGAAIGAGGALGGGALGGGALGAGGGALGGGALGGGDLGGGALGGGTLGGGGIAGGTSGGAFGFSGAGGAFGFSGAGGAFGVAGAAGAGGGGYLGGIRTGGITGGISGIPSTSNPFYSTYGNPYAMGYQPSTGTGTAGTAARPFGQPVYQQATTGITGTGIGGVAGAYGAGTGTTAPGGLVFATSYPVRRAPTYSTVLDPVDFPRPRIAASRLRRDLQAILNQSSALRSSPNIRVSVVGGTVVLRGTAATARDRRLAEGLLRLEPGVGDVRNLIQVRTRTNGR